MIPITNANEVLEKWPNVCIILLFHLFERTFYVTERPETLILSQIRVHSNVQNNKATSWSRDAMLKWINFSKLIIAMNSIINVHQTDTCHKTVLNSTTNVTKPNRNKKLAHIWRKKWKVVIYQMESKPHYLFSVILTLVANSILSS